MNNKVDNYIKIYQESLVFYHFNNSNQLNEISFSKIKKELDIKNIDMPIILWGITSEIITHEPGNYFDKKSFDEMYSYLELLLKESNKSELKKSFEESLEYFFVAIKSYFLIGEMIKEFTDVSFDESFKNSFFRSTLYSKIVEEVLMNLYRFIAIFMSFQDKKDYRPQQTLGNILPPLSKKFSVLCNVDKNLRNAINHGNLIFSGNDILYRYEDKDNKKIITNKMTRWEFDKKILSIFDIGSAIILGILKFLIENPSLLKEIIEEEDRSPIQYDWFQLQFFSSNTKIKFIESLPNNKQLNIHLKCLLLDKEKILYSMFEILKIAYFSFPDYKCYFIGYSHERSPSGFFRITREELGEKIKEHISGKQLTKLKKDDNNILMLFDINDKNINAREYRYFIFPEISGKDWIVKNLEIISVKDIKRIKGNLIIENKKSKEEIIQICKKSIDKIKIQYTPPDPKLDVPFGNIEADAVFLNVFERNNIRDSYNLFIENSYFICMVHYYKSEDVTRLDHGGVMDWLWEKYIKFKQDNIDFAWNPNY